MQEQALKLASRVPHPEMIAAFALMLAAIAFAILFRAKKPFVASVVAAGLIVLGLAP
jgi:hypothetical protein